MAATHKKDFYGRETQKIFLLPRHKKDLYGRVTKNISMAETQKRISMAATLNEYFYGRVTKNISMVESQKGFLWPSHKNKISMAAIQKILLPRYKK
jgi:hypothetical protein